MTKNTENWGRAKARERYVAGGGVYGRPGKREELEGQRGGSSPGGTRREDLPGWRESPSIAPKSQFPPPPKVLEGKVRGGSVREQEQYRDEDTIFLPKKTEGFRRDPYTQDRTIFNPIGRSRRDVGDTAAEDRNRAKGGRIKHSDAAQDKTMVRKAMKEHDTQLHGGKRTKLTLKRGGRG